MRRSLLILLLIELLVSIASGQIGHVDNPAMASAYKAWQQNPTPETRRAWEREKRITELTRWSFSGVLFAVLAGVTILVYRVRRGEQDAAPNSRPPSQLPRSEEIQSSDSQRTPASGGRQ